MEVNERISEVLRYSQLSIKEFVLKTGIKTIQAVYDLLNGRTKSISSSVETKILSCFPEINRVWLLTGEGDMLNNLPQQSEEAEPSENIRYWEDVSATGGCMEFLENPDEHKVKMISVPRFADCTDAVNIYGDSMYPVYKSGEIILIKPWTESFIDYGCCYLIVTKNGNRMVKYLKKSQEPENVLCVSENQHFDPFEINRSDILRLFLVRGSIKADTV